MLDSNKSFPDLLKEFYLEFNKLQPKLDELTTVAIQAKFVTQLTPEKYCFQVHLAVMKSYLLIEAIRAEFNLVNQVFLTTPFREYVDERIAPEENSQN